MDYKDLREYEGTYKDIFNDIMSFKKEHGLNVTIFQLIVIFCDENNYDELEIGELIRKNKKFREVLAEDLKINNEAIFYDEEDVNILSDWLN